MITMVCVCVLRSYCLYITVFLKVLCGAMQWVVLNVCNSKYMGNSAKV